MADTSNYGFGTYGASGELVAPVTITKGTLPPGLVPARSTRDERQEKEEQWDMVLGSLLGMGMPLLSEKGIEMGARLLGFEEDHETYREEVLLPWLEEQRSFEKEQKRWEEGGEEAQIFADPRAPGMMEREMMGVPIRTRGAPQRPPPFRPRKTIYETAATGSPPIDTTGLTAIDKWELERSRKKTDIALPSIPGRKTLKRGAQAAADAASVLPGLALKTPAGTAAFTKTLGDQKTARATVRGAQMKARTDREEARGTAIEEGIDERTRTKVRFHGTMPPLKGQTKARPVQRDGYVVGDQRWVISKGDENFDVDTNGRVVPKGETYRNPSLTSIFRDIEEASPITAPYVNTITGEGAQGAFYPKLFRPDGTSYSDTVIMWKGAPTSIYDLPKETRDQHFKENGAPAWMAYRDVYNPSPRPKGDDRDGLIKTWEGHADWESSLEQLSYFADKVINLAKDSPEAFTRVGTALNFLNSLGADFRAFTATVSGDYNDAVKDAFDEKTGLEAVRLQASLNDYLAALKSNASSTRVERSRQTFLDAMDDFEGNTGESFFKPEGATAWREVSAERSILMGTQLQMAYMAAATAGQTGRTLSDKDLANFLRVIGMGESTDSEVVAKKVADFIGSVVATRESKDALFRGMVGASGEKGVRSYLTNVLGVDRELLNKTKTDPKAVTQVEDAMAKETNQLVNSFIKWDEEKKAFVFIPIARKDLQFLNRFTKDARWSQDPGKGWFDIYDIDFRPAGEVAAERADMGVSQVQLEAAAALEIARSGVVDPTIYGGPKKKRRRSTSSDLHRMPRSEILPTDPLNPLQ